MNLWLLTWQVFFVNVLLQVIVDAYGYGAPIEVCNDPVPWHGAMPQSTPSPITLTASQNNYIVNSTINVIINGSRNIEGFMLGAKRAKGDTEELLGTWVNCSTSVVKYSWPSTDFGQDNCITHAAEVNKNSIICQWRAPSINVGDIYFRAAIVVLKQTFWLNVKSPVIASPSALVTNASYTSVYFGSASTNGCGSSLGCILYPAGCNTFGNCQAFVNFAKVSNYLDVTVQAQATGYVSLGFSMDRRMGDDETVTCALNPDNNQIEVQRGYNYGYFNSRLRYTTLLQLEGKSSGGLITCRFLMPLSTIITIGGRSVNFDRNSNGLYAFLAVGDVWPGTSAVNQHQLTPFRTLMPVDFTSTKIYTFSTFPILIQFHTFLMILMWFGLAVPASHIPAHLRTNLGVEPAWRSWIRLHMTAFVIAVSCGIIGVICALVHRGGIAQTGLVHAVFGLITMALFIVQIAMGFLRPSPDASKRYIYNIAHGVNGLIISIIGSVTVHLGFNMSLVNPTMTTALNITVSILLGLNVVVMILFRIKRFRALKRVNLNDIQMKNMENNPIKVPINRRGQDIPHISNRLYIIYLVCNSMLTLAILIILVLL